MPESLFYSLRPANFIKIESLTQVFSCEFCKHLSKNTFYRTPPVVASVKACNFTKIRLPTGVFCELSKNFRNIFFFFFFDALQEFSKSSQKYWWKKCWLNILLQIAVCKLSRPCVVFKRWCNCLILCESCYSHNWPTLQGKAGKQQLEIIRD